jgi:hypothetical protein
MSMSVIRKALALQGFWDDDEDVGKLVKSDSLHEGRAGLRGEVAGVTP